MKPQEVVHVRVRTLPLTANLRVDEKRAFLQLPISPVVKDLITN